MVCVGLGIKLKVKRKHYRKVLSLSYWIKSYKAFGCRKLTFSFLNMSATMLSAVVRELAFMELPLIRFSGSARGRTQRHSMLVEGLVGTDNYELRTRTKHKIFLQEMSQMLVTFDIGS